MKSTFKLATIFNIPIEINYSWFLVVGLVIFTLASGYFPETEPGLTTPVYWLMAFIAALLFFASLLAHELSHSLVAVRNDLPIHGITLFIFGGVAHLEQEPESPGVELRMAAAGPAMSLCLGLFFFALTQILYGFRCPSYLLAITNYLFLINLGVALFNLLPGFPLDGGRILRAILWRLTKDIRRATAVASTCGKIMALVMIGAGLLYFFSGLYLSGLWFIFIGLFVREAAETSYRQVVMKKLLSGVRVKSLMTRDVITVPADLTLDRLLDEYFFRYRFTAFPVIEDDTLLGLITFHSVKEIDRAKWPQLTVRDALQPITSQLTIGPDTDLTSALPRLTSGRLLVVEAGRLVGILTRRDVMKLFEIKPAVNVDQRI